MTDTLIKRFQTIVNMAENQIELNPSNYDHEDACRLNDEAVEICGEVRAFASELTQAIATLTAERDALKAELQAAGRNVARLQRLTGEEVAEIKAPLTAENERLREALRKCRRAVSGGRPEPRMEVREIVDEAIEEHDRKAALKGKS